ncbi:MAG: class I SAM-dependent methyltransferase [Bacteroidales bacterium]|nr:class I SAM-dependent methyltransferase [Bacteroidales bacterium]
MKNEEKFWNNPENIRWFNDQPVSNYWVQFFQNNRLEIKRVLDLGCGAGRNTQFLFEYGFDVFACDYYDGMVEAARKRLLKQGFKKQVVINRVIKSSMLDLPYEDNFFDAILSNGVFHNVSNLKEMQRTLSESSRVIRKGGFLCFNLFSSLYIDPSLIKIKNNVYLTKEGLPMILLSKQEFLNLCQKFSLIIEGKIIEYKRNVTTGTRSVMRGVLKRV